MAEPVEGEREALRLVIADDAADLRILLQARLSRYDDVQVVDAVPDGLQAVDAVDRTRPDAILLDLSMPRMDGLEAATVIRARHPHLAIIVLSGHPVAVMGDRALAAGASAYIEKSLDMTDLVQALRALTGAPAAI